MISDGGVWLERAWQWMISEGAVWLGLSVNGRGLTVNDQWRYCVTVRVNGTGISVNDKWRCCIQHLWKFDALLSVLCPRLCREKTLSQLTSEHSEVLDPRCVSPLDRARHNRRLKIKVKKAPQPPPAVSVWLWRGRGGGGCPLNLCLWLFFLGWYGFYPSLIWMGVVLCISAQT